MMSIFGGRNTLRCLAHFLVVSAALMSGLKPAFRPWASLPKGSHKMDAA
jgi:hypothetical protein